MHGTYIRFVAKFSPLSPFLLFSPCLSVLPVSALLRAFFLATITDVKTEKTDISFLTLFS